MQRGYASQLYEQKTLLVFNIINIKKKQNRYKRDRKKTKKKRIKFESGNSTTKWLSYSNQIKIEM